MPITIVSQIDLSARPRSPTMRRRTSADRVPSASQRGHLHGLGDPATGRAVLAAHHAGVREAVAYLDGHLGTRRGHGGVQHVSGRGLLAVGFDHRTSREGDPLLHTHLVVANRTQGPDGRWTAVDGRDLYRHRLAADAVYRATYQRELSRSLGVDWRAADAYGTGSSKACPRTCCGRSPSGPTRSTRRWSGWRPPGGSGRPGWSSGPCMPPANPRRIQPPRRCMDGGGPRRPSAVTTRTPWSGR
jgi:TrwC relaxase